MTALQKRQADAAVLNGQEFFRLFQTLESGGDIYEINTSTKAICIGPQSDLANYAVNFFDAQAPDNIDEMTLSINNPIIGRVDALLDTEYPLASGLPAFVLVSPRDLISNTFVPSTFAVGDLVLARPLPRIDIISYLAPPPNLAPLRDDRLYSFPFLAGLSPNTGYYILPYYGRRYAEFSMQDLETTVGYTVEIRGINLFPGTQTTGGGGTPVSAGSPKAVETVLAGGSFVVAGAANRLIKSDTDGMFDMLSIAITADAALADVNSVMQVLVSDRIS